MIISIGAEKAPHTIQHPFIMKTPGDKENTQPNKSLYDKPSVNILLNFEKVKLYLWAQGQDRDVHSHH